MTATVIISSAASKACMCRETWMWKCPSATPWLSTVFVRVAKWAMSRGGTWSFPWIPVAADDSGQEVKQAGANGKQANSLRLAQTGSVVQVWQELALTSS